MIVGLYFALVVAVTVAVAVVCVVRRERLLRDECQRRIAGLWMLSGSDPLGEPGVSLLVDFDTDEQTLESLLSLDYLRYEVIVAGDVATDSRLAWVVRRYAMIEVSERVDGEGLHHPRRLFRSRRRSYRRLVVVDTDSPIVAGRMDCALSVRTFDRVVVVERGVRLLPDALRVLVWRACEVTDAEVVTAPLLGSYGIMGAVAEMWGFVGWRGGDVALVDGERVVSAGGFVSLLEGRGARHTIATRVAKRLGAQGASLSRMSVAVGRKSHLQPPLGWVDVVVWHLLLSGVLLVVASDGTLRQTVAVGLAVLWFALLLVAVSSRAFCRTAGCRRPWWMSLVAPMALLARIVNIRKS